MILYIPPFLWSVRRIGSLPRFWSHCRSYREQNSEIWVVCSSTKRCMLANVMVKLEEVDAAHCVLSGNGNDVIGEADHVTQESSTPGWAVKEQDVRFSLPRPTDHQLTKSKLVRQCCFRFNPHKFTCITNSQTGIK